MAIRAPGISCPSPRTTGWRRARTGQSRERPGSGGSAGHLLLAHAAIPDGHELAILAEDIVAEIVVVDPALPMALPAGRFRFHRVSPPITDEELAAAGGLKRTIVMRTVFNEPDEPITNAPANAIVHPGDELDTWVFQTGKTTMANKVFALGSAGGQASPRLRCQASTFPSSRRAR